VFMCKNWGIWAALQGWPLLTKSIVEKSISTLTVIFETKSVEIWAGFVLLDVLYMLSTPWNILV